jgi:hypothetical protein
MNKFVSKWVSFLTALSLVLVLVLQPVVALAQTADLTQEEALEELLNQDFGDLINAELVSRLAEIRAKRKALQEAREEVVEEDLVPVLSHSKMLKLSFGDLKKAVPNFSGTEIDASGVVLSGADLSVVRTLGFETGDRVKTSLGQIDFVSKIKGDVDAILLLANFVDGDKIVVDFVGQDQDVEFLLASDQLGKVVELNGMQVKLEVVDKVEFEEFVGESDFNDVSGSDWFNKYVGNAKKRKLVDGYKDANGNLTGEFGPADNVTVAELLKIAARVFRLQEKAGEPVLQSGRSHWARGYVKLAENLGVTIVKDANLDLNRPATRGEVTRVMLEFSGVLKKGLNSAQIEACNYADLTSSDPNYLPICLASKLGVVSGDDNGGARRNFRPAANLVRAEVAKIADSFANLFDYDFVAIDEDDGFFEGGEIMIDEDDGFFRGGEVMIDEDDGF